MNRIRGYIGRRPFTCCQLGRNHRAQDCSDILHSSTHCYCKHKIQSPKHKHEHSTEGQAPNYQRRNAHLPVNRESKRGVAAHARLSLTQAVKTENTPATPASGNDSDRSFSHGVGMKQTCWHNMSNSSSSGNNNCKTIISCVSMGALGVADGAQQNLQHAQARAGRTAKPNPSRHPRHRRAGL